MQLKNKVLAIIFGSLVLPSCLMSQSILEVVQARKKNDLFRMNGKLFVMPQAGIKSLDGIEQIPGIARAWSLALSGNDVEVVKANTFNHPQFKNLHALDLSNNKISSVEPGALNGLESLNFLWLSGNQLSSLPDGALSSLNKNKNLFVFVGNNPGGKELLKQVKKQLPKANVYITTMKREVLKAAAITAGIVAAIVGVVLAGKYAYEKSRPVYGPTITPEQQRQVAEEQRAEEQRAVAAKREERAKKKLAKPEIPEEAMASLTGERFPATVEEREERGKIIRAEELLEKVGQEYADIRNITAEYLRHPNFSIEAQFLVGTQGQELPAKFSPVILEAKAVYERLRKLNLREQQLPTIPPYLLDNGLALEALLFETSEADRAKIAQHLLFAEAQYATKIIPSIMKLLQQHGADVNAVDAQGRTALMIAAWNGNVVAIKALLAAPGINVNAADAQGRAALLLAARKGYATAIKALIAAGANVNAADHNGWTALMIAARKGDATAIKALLVAGANVNAADHYGWTALLLAVTEGHAEAMQALIVARGIHVNAAGPEGRTALMIAARKGDATAIKALLAAGANVNAADHNGRTALMMASDNVQVAAVQALLAAPDINVNAADAQGWTALDLAYREFDFEEGPVVIKGSDEIAELLKQHGALTGEQLPTQ